ncbi:ATP-binding protein [Methanococcoides vulcani]|nr:ATP-binding protein [Methanococcoides vulcani]
MIEPSIHQENECCIRVEDSSSRNYGGNGIGLALVKYFVDMYKGDVWIES